MTLQPGTRLGPYEIVALLGRDRRAALEQLNLVPSNLADPHALVFGAVVYADLGDRTRALTWLEGAAAHGLQTSELRDWIELDTLTGDPRYATLVKK